MPLMELDVASGKLRDKCCICRKSGVSFSAAHVEHVEVHDYL